MENKNGKRVLRVELNTLFPYSLVILYSSSYQARMPVCCTPAKDNPSTHSRSVSLEKQACCEAIYSLDIQVSQRNNRHTPEVIYKIPHHQPPCPAHPH